MLVEPRYDELLQMIYAGPLEEQPFASALLQLREILDTQVASLVLRPPTDDDPGVILNCVRPPEGSEQEPGELADSDDWEATAYREQFFSLDPFINLSLDTVTSLDDLLSDRELEASDYYRYYLQPIDLYQILGVDMREPGGMLARLRFGRRRQEDRFDKAQRDLLKAVVPHLRQAIRLYAQLSRTRSERDIYAGAVDQLSVATIILDEQGRVLNTNAVAARLLASDDAIGLREQRLLLANRDSGRKLQAAIDEVIHADQQGQAALVRAMRVARGDGRADLGLVVRPPPDTARMEGQAVPAAAVFVSDPELRESASQQTLGDLFDLTPAETRLAISLSRGLSLAEAAETQGISQHTARAQLKAIFAKTGASRQAELVRLVLTSVASLG
ncbi:MAG: helix-turn-helix transcriptional regulator [Pseudomonadota bacterium]